MMHEIYPGVWKCTFGETETHTPVKMHGHAPQVEALAVLPKAELPFEHYRYSIAVENGIEPYYFTEKILNCFAAQTIPIYLGATKIDQFFNADGIIQIGLEDCEHIEKILKLCTAEEYERRLPAVLDNFNRAMRAMSQTRWDDVYVNYIRGK